MDGMTAYCGLPCDTCPILRATLEPDLHARAAMRAEIARLCTAEYGMPMVPEDVDDCDGCRAGGRLFSGCSNCRVRPCAVARGLETCADCPDFACAPLRQHWEHDPVSRTRLEALRAARPRPTAPQS